MADSPNNPEEIRNQTSAMEANDKKQNPEPSQREIGITDTKKPSATNQPHRKTDPSGTAFNDDDEDDFNTEEE